MKRLLWIVFDFLVVVCAMALLPFLFLCFVLVLQAAK